MTSETLSTGRVRQLIVAGWTGRDRVAQEKHIAELEQVGVRRPSTTPVYYRVSSSRLTLANKIQVAGDDSSGEVEFVIFKSADRLWIGVGSDHTDRKVEAYNITVSKQMCDKPVAGEMWLLDELTGHWDELMLRSWAIECGDRRLYQEGRVSSMLHPRDLIAGYERETGDFAEGSAMFGGTFAAIGGIRSADRFEFELEDPILLRRLAHAYDVIPLPVMG